MKSRIRIAAAAAVVSIAGTAAAHGVSSWIGGLEGAVTATKAALADSPGRLRHANLMARYLHAKSNRTSLAAEFASVSKAAAVFETKLQDQPLLADAFFGAGQGYSQDIAATRNALTLAANSPLLPKANRTKYRAALRRFEAAFTAKRKPTTPLVDQFNRSAVAARAAAGFTPYDGGRTYDWVISSLRIAGAGVGADLDGDGTIDNQLGAIQTQLGVTDLDELINSAIASGGRYALIEMWYLKTLAKPDKVIFAGLMGATDGDGDTANDFSGSGVFAVDGGAVSLDDRHASMRVATALGKRGAYKIVAAGQVIQLGGIVFPPASKIVIKAKATGSTNLGVLALGIPVDTIVSMAATAGVPLNGTQQLLLAQFADLDLDSDPSRPGNDALSVSCTFTAVKAVVTRP